MTTKLADDAWPRTRSSESKAPFAVGLPYSANTCARRRRWRFDPVEKHLQPRARGIDDPRSGRDSQVLEGACTKPARRQGEGRPTAGMRHLGAAKARPSRDAVPVAGKGGGPMLASFTCQSSA